MYNEIEDFLSYFEKYSRNAFKLKCYLDNTSLVSSSFSSKMLIIREKSLASHKDSRKHYFARYIPAKESLF